MVRRLEVTWYVADAWAFLAWTGSYIAQKWLKGQVTVWQQRFVS